MNNYREVLSSIVSFNILTKNIEKVNKAFNLLRNYTDYSELNNDHKIIRQLIKKEDFSEENSSEINLNIMKDYVKNVFNKLFKIDSGLNSELEKLLISKGFEVHLIFKHIFSSQQ